MFLVAFRSGQREEKHGIYYIKHTLPTLEESRVLCSFLVNFGGRLGTWDYISVFKYLPGSALEKETKRQEQVEFKEEITSFFQLEKVSKTD